MKSLKEVLSSSIEYLSQKDIVDPEGQAKYLISDLLEIKGAEIYFCLDKMLSEDQEAFLEEALYRRGQGEPVQYILKEVDFYGCKITVNPDVLIPRQETELLVDLIASENLDGVLWDVCCGSGCIGIALKKKFPNLSVVMSDISNKSLKLARSNTRDNDVQINCISGDLLEPFAGQKADYIVCNPPYVSKEEWMLLDTEVKDYEPPRALIAGERGTEFYERLSLMLGNYLKPSGKAWFEIGATQGQEVLNLFKFQPWVKSCCVDKDLSGQDRFFSLERE